MALPHVWPLRVYWEDTDAAGMVFYANYLKYLERGRSEWLRSLGYGQEILRARYGALFIVCDLTIAYRSPARLDDELIVQTRLAHCGYSAVQVQQQVYKAGHFSTAPAELGPLLCQAQVRLAWVEQQPLRPVRMPTALRTQLLALQTAVALARV